MKMKKTLIQQILECFNFCFGGQSKDKGTFFKEKSKLNAVARNLKKNCLHMFSANFVQLRVFAVFLKKQTLVGVNF